MTSSGWIRQSATQMHTRPDTQQNRHMDRRAFFKTLALASSAALVDWTGMGALADSIPNKADCPVVIIGSGLGGLVCGAYLARSGFDITLPAKDPEGVKARSQDLSRTLTQGIRNSGGRIRYNTRAEQILFAPDNTITGVKDHQGTVYPAKAVIANCPVPALVNTLVPPEVLPASFAAQARQRRPSLSSFVVWLGLNQTLPGITDYEIDLAGTAGAPGNHLFNPADLAESGIGITIYDNLFRGYSAEGKTTLVFICLSDYARWQKYETDYFNNRKDAYNREKERIAARFIQRVEKALIPGLSGMIEEMEIGTPLTNVFYTGNTGGAIYGYDRNRPHLESKTPVKGLYLASAWSHGGGYTPVMMGGRQTALQVIKDFRAAEQA